MVLTRGKASIFVAIPDCTLRNLLFEPPAREKLERLGKVYWPSSGEPVTVEEMEERLPETDVLLTTWGTPNLTDSMITGADRLAFIGHCAGSVANLCPRSVYERGITVVSANRMMARGVAEHAVFATLLGMRRYETLRQNMGPHNNYWINWDERFQIGKALPEATVGVIGLGAVSQRLIPILQALDMRVLAFGLPEEKKVAASLGCIFSDLETLLKESDCVHLLCSLTPATQGLLSREGLALMKDNCVLVNAGRGGLVDQQALLDNLEAGRFYAVLDVTDPEPPPADSPLRSLPNVYLTPHSAALAHDSFYGRLVVEQLEQFLDGEVPRDIVSREKADRMTGSHKG